MPPAGRAALRLTAGCTLTLLLAGCALAGTTTPGATTPGTTTPGTTTPGTTTPGTTTASRTTSSGSPSANDDPAVFARQVDASARAARINPQLLMAILYNESYKPHDAAFERAWHQLEPDSAFGVANMHRGAFEDTKRGRDFAGRRWEELPDDPALAIEAAAWYLHDLAVRLPLTWSAHYTKDDLLALGYNAGPGNMLAFARGGHVLPVARTYLDKLHENWATAAAALARR